MICRYKIKFISDIEQKIRKLLVNIAVAPFVGVWIEICKKIDNATTGVVAPFVGVWIEIFSGTVKVIPDSWSLPSWECGLKLDKYEKISREIKSLPSWECGLKWSKNQTVSDV